MSPSRLIASITAGALLAACSSSSNPNPKLSSRFVDSRGKSGTQQQSLGGLEGLYFGELEIVAYDYRPGQAVQNHAPSSGFTSPNWSYWIALANGYDNSRDNVLASSGQLDFSEFGDNAPDIEQPFIDSVGAFDIDFLEVYLYRTGLIQNGQYYGMNADLNGLDKHPLHKYPQWATIPDTYTMPLFPGFPNGGQDVNVLFARNDWFPTALTVLIDQNTRKVASSSIPLTADQTAKIESLVGEGTTRRFYQNLVIVPFAGPISVGLTGQTLPDGGIQGAAGGGTSASGNQFLAENLQITVNFNLSDILDASTDLAATPPAIAYKGDANNVPFGLTVTFAPR
jgi:hypothetical protein